MASRQDPIESDPPPQCASPTEKAAPPSPRKDDVDVRFHESKRTDTGFSSFDKVAVPGRLVEDEEKEDEFIHNAPAETATDFITEVIHAEDDPSLNPWTFRTWFVGMRSP
jgi:hypothetical protein